MMTALIPSFFRSSCSGSAAQFRNVTTSFAICEVVAGVPGNHQISQGNGERIIYDRGTDRRHIPLARRKGHEPWKWRLQGRRGCSSCHHEFPLQQEGQCNQSEGKICNPVIHDNELRVKKGRKTHSTTVSGLYNQAKVRRKCSGISSTSGFIVWIRSWHEICQFSRSLKHFAFRVGTVGVFVFFGHYTGFVSSMRDANKITPRNAV